MASPSDEALEAPAVVERFVRQLIAAAKAVSLYPPASRIPAEACENAARFLEEALSDLSELRLAIHKTGAYVDGVPVAPGHAAFSAFFQDAYQHQLASVTFHPGVRPQDILNFVSVLKTSPEEVRSEGGFEASLWNLGAHAIAVTETQVLLVEAEVLSAGGSDELAEESLAADDSGAIDRVLEQALSGRVRERRAIARIVGEPATVRRYLETVYHAVREDEAGDLEAVASRLSGLAQLAGQGEGAEVDLARELSEALEGLDPELRHRLLAEKILPEARTSEAMAEVVRRFDPDGVLRIVLEGAGGEGPAGERAIESIRHFSAVTGIKNDELAARAAGVMRESGRSQSFIEPLLDLIAPSHLIIREQDLPEAAGEGTAATGTRVEQRPADVISRILNLDLDREPMDPGSSLVAPLLEEARLGITDGDVIATLVLLATLDVRPDKFASTMALLEDSLSVLIGRGDIDLAAQTAELMRTAARRGGLAPDQRQRLEQAVERFARPGDVRLLARALRLYPPESSEHEAARGLLGMLGPLALPTLLEQLANESDMAERKGLVELLSEIAKEYVPQLAPCIADQRWYFVRNVVSVLGSIRSTEALGLLERTLRHQDARVRRETIRSLAAIGGPEATHLLLAALDDEDASNVQLALRRLGVSPTPDTMAAVEQVARGESRGNREKGTRLAAIAVLSRAGGASSIPLLEQIAGRRRFLGPRTNDLKAAAESAIAAIKAREAAESR